MILLTMKALPCGEEDGMDRARERERERARESERAFLVWEGG